MSISTVSRVKTLLSIGDSSQDTILTQMLSGAEAAVKTWCKRVFEQANYTEYRPGTGTPDLALKQRPVNFYSLTGTLTSGSAVVTGISSTSSLIAGMPAVYGPVGATTYIPVGTTILTVDSATQVTLSAQATGSGTVGIGFGLAVYLDAGGFMGMGTDPFPDTSHLFPGKDYILDRDMPDGSSKSGLIKRLGGGLTGSHLDWPGEWRKGSLTARLPPAWPKGLGNIKVVYTAGYSTTTMPDDLKQAVDQLTVWLYKFGPTGGFVTGSESYEGYAMSLLAAASSPPQLGETRRLLSTMRDVSI